MDSNQIVTLCVDIINYDNYFEFKKMIPNLCNYVYITIKLKKMCYEI